MTNYKLHAGGGDHAPAYRRRSKSAPLTGFRVPFMASTIVPPQILVGNHLKALKLPTFAREYRALLCGDDA